MLTVTLPRLLDAVNLSSVIAPASLCGTGLHVELCVSFVLSSHKWHGRAIPRDCVLRYRVNKHQERAGHAPASANRDEKSVHGGHSLRRLDAATDGRTKETSHDGESALRAGWSEGTN